MPEASAVAHNARHSFLSKEPLLIGVLQQRFYLALSSVLPVQRSGAFAFCQSNRRRVIGFIQHSSTT